jgi:integrase
LADVSRLFGSLRDEDCPFRRIEQRQIAGRLNRQSDRTDALRMIWRRARAAGIETELGCHSFRATGITVYLQNGGLLEHAQQMAAHESARTTKLYDRRNDKVTLDEIERIVL